jgi:endo-1,4-beta-mannosidase
MENDPVRQNLAAAYICELLDIGGKPVVVEEFGLTSDYVSGDNAASYYRQVLHNSLLAGATGWLAWNNTDYDDLIDRAPYDHHPFEMHFGVTDSRGEAKPQAHEMRAFADLAAAIDLPRLSRPDAQAAIVVSSFLEVRYPFTTTVDSAVVLQNTRQAYIAAKEADIPIGVARELDGLPDDVALFIVPSTKQLLGPTWKALVARAEAGATVYASYFVGDHGPQRGLRWPGVDEMFGVTKSTRYGLLDMITDDTVEVTFRAGFGSIEAGETLSFTAAGPEGGRSFLPVAATDAEVLAVDGHDRPVLMRRRVGTGWMVLGTIPFEYFASQRPESNPEQTWRIYDGLAELAGIDRPVRVDDPRVMCAELVREDGARFVWLVSQSPEPLEVSPVVTEGELRTREGAAVSTVMLAPYGVEVLERGAGAR